MNHSLPVANILKLFTKASESSLHFVALLVEEAFEELGGDHQKEHLGQWKTLSETLDTPSKISCLRDQNHRALIVEFMKFEATKFYKSSYFNHAKIDVQYLTYLKQIGPFEFAEIIAIVNKLKLIEKHHKQRMEAMMFSESHIETHIRKIMEMCASIKRSVNNNLNKFKAIVEFQDRIELVKALGKLLRQSWSSEKKMPKASNNQHETVRPMPAEETNLTPIQQIPQSTEPLKEEQFNMDGFFFFQ